MKCDICDREDNLIHYDPRDGRFTPCGRCQDAIQECLEGYGDLDEVPTQGEVFEG